MKHGGKEPTKGPSVNTLKDAFYGGDPKVYDLLSGRKMISNNPVKGKSLNMLLN